MENITYISKWQNKSAPPSQIVTLDCGMMWLEKLRFRRAQVKFEKNHLHFLRIELEVEANVAEAAMPLRWAKNSYISL